MHLKLTNSFSRTKELFTPHNKENVGMYVCGITPYDYAHLGHGRCYTQFDVLFRLLQFLGYNVTYVRNFTDIDDKIINRAQKESVQFSDIAQKFINAYTQDMARLNCLAPTHEPRVTALIPEIITFVGGLIEKGHAYVIDNDVYFDISTYPSYGKLSGRAIDDLKAGARVSVDTRKKNDGDFALWKGTDEGTFWQSPWGYGRPGWHIECSVMARQYLGSTIDIHGGGMDLLFPHHENERAQSECLCGCQFVRVWLHNAFVNINKEKMSKSLNNFITLRAAFEVVDPMVLRYFYLQHHYRTPIDFNDQDLQGARSAYQKLVMALRPDCHTGGSRYPDSLAQDESLDPVLQRDDKNGFLKRREQNLAIATQEPLAHSMVEALCDDMNTPKLLGIVFEHLTTIRNSPQLASFANFIFISILGLTLQPLPQEDLAITPEISDLIQQREQARIEKNWARADQLRDELLQRGYKVQDKKV